MSEQDGTGTGITHWWNVLDVDDVTAVWGGEASLFKLNRV